MGKQVEMIGKCRVVRGRWLRWVGEQVSPDGSGYSMHRFDDDTRIVENVTAKEYDARPDQLMVMEGRHMEMRSLFDGQKVTHGNMEQARAEIMIATANDLDALRKLYEDNERKGLEQIFLKKINALGRAA